MLSVRRRVCGRTRRVAQRGARGHKQGCEKFDPESPSGANPIRLRDIRENMAAAQGMCVLQGTFLRAVDLQVSHLPSTTLLTSLSPAWKIKTRKIEKVLAATASGAAALRCEMDEWGAPPGGFLKLTNSRKKRACSNPHTS